MATLLAITYSEVDRAKRAMETVINWLDIDRLVDVQGACWVSKDEGELKVYPRGRHTAGKAAAGGTSGCSLAGFSGSPQGRPPVCTGPGGRTTASTKPSSPRSGSNSRRSAVLVLVEEGADTARAAQEVAKFAGTVHSADLPPDRLARFQAMLDQAGPDVHSSGTGDHRRARRPRRDGRIRCRCAGRCSSPSPARAAGRSPARPCGRTGCARAS